MPIKKLIVKSNGKEIFAFEKVSSLEELQPQLMSCINKIEAQHTTFECVYIGILPIYESEESK